MDAPNTWIGLMGVSIVTVGGWVKVWLDARRNHRTMEGVSNQLTNGHRTLLREDLDDIRDAVHTIRDDMRHVRGEIIDLRGEIRHERQSRSNLESVVNAHLTPRRPWGKPPVD